MLSLTTVLAFGAALTFAVGLLLARGSGPERVRVRIEDREARQ